ncbi:MAG: endolytic transglycosylase MltG [Byssovorax sp.]
MSDRERNKPRSSPASSRSTKKPASPAPRSKRPKPRLGKAELFTKERRQALAWLGGALGGTLLLGLAGLLLGYGRMHGPAGTGPVEVDWPAGLSSEEAAARLVDLGLADSRDTLTLFIRASGGTEEFATGPHLLPRGATPWELRRYLARSMFRPGAKLTVPEGFNRFDIGARLEKLQIAGKKSFLAASADHALLAELGVDGGKPPNESAEGFLFPATYEFGLDSDPREIVRRLVTESNKRWEAITAQRKDGLGSLKSTLGWGRREVITLASIIEKEAAVDDERPLIASVFLNRLTDPNFHPKRLQSDPTSSYGCFAFAEDIPSCAAFSGKPTPAINRDAKNTYSTYVHEGLPPGPISNPGSRSIEAVLSPMPTRFLYFVAAGGGRHHFSEDLDTHNDAVHRGREP